MIVLFTAMATLALVPSTSVALVVATSSAAGYSRGIAVTAGIVLGDLVFVFLAILGMASLAEVMGGFFIFLRYAAGAYLIWLGIKLIRARPSSSIAAPARPAPTLLTSFLTGLLITLGDVKAIFFYASLFPAFIDLAAVSASDIVVISTVTIGAVGGVKLGYVYFAGTFASVATKHGAGRTARTAAGGLMIGAGSYLVVKA